MEWIQPPNRALILSSLRDRTYVYEPNSVKGKKPINIGHSYSVVSFLPEKDDDCDAPWAIPLSGQRVSSEQKDVYVGNQQINKILNHPDPN